MTIEGTLQHTKKVSWNDVYHEVKAANDKLAHQLNRAISEKKKNPKNPSLFKASYPYGEPLVKNGQFFPPCNHCGPCNHLAQVARSIPLTLILDNSVEVYLGLDPPAKRDIPLRLLKRGELFGAFETLDNLVDLSPKPPWSVSAGARSVKVLFPLGDKTLKSKISLAINRSIDPQEDTHELIRLAAEKAGSPWAVDVLVFPYEWLKGVLTPEFTNEIYRIGWLQSDNLRRRFLDDFFTASMSVHAVLRGGTNVGQLDRYATLRHLILIAKGEAPAFQPTPKGEAQLGPFESFQKFVTELALNKSYFPVVLYASELTRTQTAGYYSLREPSLLHPTHEAPTDKWLQRLKELIDTVDRVRKFNSVLDVSTWSYFSGEKGRLKKKQTEESQDQDKKRPQESEEKRTDPIMHPSILMEEFLREQKQPGLGLYTGHPFFKACVRIIRQ